MNNKFKRVISSILAFTMVISVLTVMNVTTAFAAIDTDNLDSSVTTVYNFFGETAQKVLTEVNATVGNGTAKYYSSGSGTYIGTEYTSSYTGLKFTADTSSSAPKFDSASAVTDKSHLEIPASAGETIYVYGTYNSDTDTTTKLLFLPSTTVPSDTTDYATTVSLSRRVCWETFYTVPSTFTGDTIYIISSGKNVCIAAVAIVGSSETSLKVDQSSASLKVGETLTVNATANNAGENPSITWSSDDTEGTIVSLSGTTSNSVTITAIGEGDATITATMTYEEVEYTAKVSVNVYIPEISLTVDPTSAKLQAGETVEVTATPVNTEESKDYSISWSSSNTAVATVSDETGDTVTITAVGVSEEDAIITATMTYEEKEYTAEVSVNVYEVTVDDSAALTATAPSTYDDSYTTITTNEDGSVTYSYDFAGIADYAITNNLNDGVNYNIVLTNGVIEGSVESELDEKELYNLSSTKNLQVVKDDTTNKRIKFSADTTKLYFSIGDYCKANVDITIASGTATVTNEDSGKTVTDLTALETGNYAITRGSNGLYITKLEITVMSTADAGEINGNTIKVGDTTYLIANLDGCTSEDDLAKYDYVYLAKEDGTAVDGSGTEGSGTVYTGVKIEGVEHDATEFDESYKYIYCFAIDSTYAEDVSGYKLVGHAVETTATEE